MPMTTEVVGLDQATEILDRVLKIRDPEKYEQVMETRREVRKAREQGKTTVYGGEWKAERYEGGRTANTLSAFGLTGLNRDLNFPRVELYREEMLCGRWLDSPDPIVISEDGLILNGQHRLAAACGITFVQDGEVFPQMVVVWGVGKKSAIIMDEAKRSANDRREIALKYVHVAEETNREKAATK